MEAEPVGKLLVVRLKSGINIIAFSIRATYHACYPQIQEKPLKERCFSISVFIASVLLATTAFAADLKIVTVDLPPYGYTMDNAPAGLTFEIGNALAREAGLNPVNRIARLQRGVEEIANGRADLVIMLSTPKVKEVAIALGQVMPMETVVMGHSGVPLGAPEDLIGKTVASVRDARYDNRISDNSGVTLYPCKNYLHGLKMVAGKRVDAIIGPRLGLLHSIRDNGLSRQDFGEPLILRKTFATVFLSRKAPAEYWDRLRQALRQIKVNGTADELIGKYSL